MITDSSLMCPRDAPCWNDLVGVDSMMMCSRKREPEPDCKMAGMGSPSEATSSKTVLSTGTLFPISALCLVEESDPWSLVLALALANRETSDLRSEVDSRDTKDREEYTVSDLCPR